MSFARVESIVSRGIAAGSFPAACLLVARDGGEPVVHRAFGRADLHSVFDLASLTKPLATAATMMRRVGAGRFSVDAPLGQLLPSAGRSGVCEATLAQLLAHCAGLPAWRPYYERLHSLPFAEARRRLRRALLAEPLEAPPGARSVYSDLGFMLLDWALERESGQRLHQLARREVYRPLGLRSTSFYQLDVGDEQLARAPAAALVPTERCPRRGRLCGEVHDDNAHAIGGVAGHAGLFSTAHEVHLLVRELVAAHGGERSLFERDVVRLFWGARPARAARGRPDGWALGWDRPTRGARSSAGADPPRNAVGHLGFTGTSIWIDLDRRAWVILLTNRVYRGREPNPMKALRPRLHDAAWRALAALRAR
jgi:CubicO group peptidase (beta-lactamase class C family)